MANNQDQTNYILNENTPFHVQEAYKNLRTNIQFSLEAGKCHLIGVSSAERGDGKSTTSVNIALSFAQLGKKAVVIDCDMRIPTVAKKLNIKGTPGLSNYLVGDNTFKEVCKMDKKTGLYVIPSGNIPPDPTWLLQSERMQQLIDELKNYMDYIFLDLPPVTIVTDALMLSSLVDGYLLVVQSGGTSKKKIDEMIASLKLVDARILGFVNTRSDANGSSKYYKSYRKRDYYSRYGYQSYESSNKN